LAIKARLLCGEGSGCPGHHSWRYHSSWGRDSDHARTSRNHQRHVGCEDEKRERKEIIIAAKRYIHTILLEVEDITTSQAACKTGR